LSGQWLHYLKVSGETINYRKSQVVNPKIYFYPVCIYYDIFGITLLILH